MRLFNERISGWPDWCGLFQSIPAFAPLIQYILRKEHLPPAEISRLTPGSNAVFRAGRYAVKIYAPPEAAANQSPGDFETELFAAGRAKALGVSTPGLAAEGVVEDRYRFAYIITEFIEGASLAEAVKTMTESEREAAGQKLRAAADMMNTPCEPFNGIDVFNDKTGSRRWDKFPESFRAERLAYIKSHDFGENVFVHGDLCLDNILVTPSGELYIIDFADAVLAPAVYEFALAGTELFDFGSALRGFFGGVSREELAGICFDGLLIHGFGGGIAEARVCKPAETPTLGDLRKGLEKRILPILD